MDSTPGTPFEALFGHPPVAEADVQIDAMHMDSVGKRCDFCTRSTDTPAVWAYPCGQTDEVMNMGNSGRTINLPVAAGLWYACADCNRFIKAGAWAALAKDHGYPQGSAGNRSWQSFRVARIKGSGYAWPLNPKKLGPVPNYVSRAWAATLEHFTGDDRARLDAVVIVADILSTFHGHLPDEAAVNEIRETCGPRLVAALRAELGRDVHVALSAPRAPQNG